MKELKIYISDELNELFRKTAMDAYGYGRGSISKAAQEALSQWCAMHQRAGGSPSQSSQSREPDPVTNSDHGPGNSDIVKLGIESPTPPEKGVNG